MSWTLVDRCGTQRCISRQGHGISDVASTDEDSIGIARRKMTAWIERAREMIDLPLRRNLLRRLVCLILLRQSS